MMKLIHIRDVYILLNITKKGGIIMSRTPERVLSIISVVFTALALIPSFLIVAFGKALSQGEIRKEIEMELLTDPELTGDETDIILSMFESISGFGWFFVVVLLISLVATIIGMVSIWNNKNPKLAGIMFIIAGLFALVLSPTSIMLYVAAILCFTKKSPHLPTEDSFVDSNYDDTMRPL